MPIDADECTLNRHIFVQPPDGEMVNLSEGIGCDEFVPEFIDMTEEGALLFTRADAQNQWAKNPFIMYRMGLSSRSECGKGVDYSPVLCGASADGSVIGASIHGASFLRPGRWVDGSFRASLDAGSAHHLVPGRNPWSRSGWLYRLDDVRSCLGQVAPDSVESRGRSRLPSSPFDDE